MADRDLSPADDAAIRRFAAVDEAFLNVARSIIATHGLQLGAARAMQLLAQAVAEHRQTTKGGA